MDISYDDGFNLVYAKNGGIPKNIYFEDRIKVTEFFINNLNDIDFLCINDKNINKDEMINNNKKLSRYLKLMKIYEV